MTDAKIVDLSLPYPDPSKGDREVRVYVPAHEEGETFPVIYMTDGQSIFEKERNRFGSWMTRETVEAERARSGRAAIIVGISNQNPWRNNELTPRSIGKIKSFLLRRIFFKAPEGEVFGRFVTETVKPAVEAQFPVRTGKENTAFCGSSSGGLESFFIAMSYPELFGAAGVFSPVFQLYSKKNMTRWIQQKARPDMPLLYVYSGAGNPQEKQICRSVEKTYAILEKYCPAEKLRKVIRPEAPHNEAAWEPVFADFLREFLDISQK